MRPIDVMRMYPHAGGGGGGGGGGRSWSGAPGYISSGVLTAGGQGTTGSPASSINVAYPSSIMGGDAVLLEVHFMGLTTFRTISAPAGFTLLWNGQIGGTGRASGEWQVWVFIQTNLAGTESGNVTVTAAADGGSASSLFRGIMHLMAGVKKTGTVFEGADNTGSNGNAVSPAVVTTGASRLVCNIVGTDKSNGIPTVGAPAGYTENHLSQTTDGYGSTEEFNSKTQATAATVAASTTTLSTGPFYGVVSFALIPETP